MENSGKAVEGHVRKARKLSADGGLVQKIVKNITPLPLGICCIMRKQKTTRRGCIALKNRVRARVVMIPITIVELMRSGVEI